MKLKAKLILTYLGILIVPLITLGAFNHYRVKMAIPDPRLFDEIRNVSILISLLIMASGVWAVMKIARAFIVPIRKLKEGARMIGLGDLNYRIAMHRNDEFGELSDAFDAMAENLKRLTVSRAANKTAFEAMFTHASIGLIIVDEFGAIDKVNPYANQLFGYAPGEINGQKMEVLLPARIREKHVSHRMEYDKAPRSRPMGIGMDLLAIKKNGEEFPVEVSLAYYINNGKKQVVGFINDITLRKTAEEALKKLNRELEANINERTKDLSRALMELNHINDDLTREMEYRKKSEKDVRRALEKEKELNELKSRFVAMASHEFRTPLGGILTSASLIARYDNPEDGEKRLRHVNTIKMSVGNLTNILNDFLSLDKLEAGLVLSLPVDFSLREFLAEIVGDMQAIAKKNQRITFDHDGNDESVRMDKNLLRNVLVNLVSNAVKYSADGGQISVRARHDGARVVISVRDDGIGIPEADQKHLFEHFFRAHNTTAIQGTGLGLSIVKRYLDLMGGEIRFVSRENAGSTFTVSLPAR